MTPKDSIREERIEYDIVVDCYDEYERAAGWYYYLDDNLTCPFQAECTHTRGTSPLKLGEQVQVLHLADQDDCEHEMMVIVQFLERQMGIPLAQLKPLDADEQTQEAVADWHYWVERGYQF